MLDDVLDMLDAEVKEDHGMSHIEVTVSSIADAVALDVAREVAGADGWECQIRPRIAMYNVRELILTKQDKEHVLPWYDLNEQMWHSRPLTHLRLRLCEFLRSEGDGE